MQEGGISSQDGRQHTEPVMLGVLTADPLRLAAIQDLLKAETAFEVVPLFGMERHRGTAALALIDVAVTPALHPLLEQLCRTWPELRSLVIGPETNLNQVAQMIELGAKGYLPYTVDGSELRKALHVVLDGCLWAPRRVLSMVIEQRRAALAPEEPTLTEREREVLRLLVQGRSNRAIAVALSLTETTIKAHLARMMRKMGVHNRTALTMYALGRYTGLRD